MRRWARSTLGFGLAGQMRRFVVRCVAIPVMAEAMHLLQARPSFDERVTVSKERLAELSSRQEGLTARQVEARVVCASILVSDALAAMVARRLRNLYVCEAAEVEFFALQRRSRPSVGCIFTEEDVAEGAPLAPCIRVEIAGTTPGGCVVAIRRTTKVAVSFVIERHHVPCCRGGDITPRVIETAASEKVRELIGCPVHHRGIDSGVTEAVSRTILLHGLKGVGKTEAAKLAASLALEGEASRQSYCRVRCEVLDLAQTANEVLRSNEIVDVFARAFTFVAGESVPRCGGTRLQKRQSDLQYSVSLIVLDSLDAVCDKSLYQRSPSNKEICVQLASLVRQVARLSSSIRGHVVVAATARRKDNLDQTMLDSFELEHEIKPPELCDRTMLIQTHLHGSVLALPELLQKVGTKAVGYVAADVATLCLVAKRAANLRVDRSIRIDTPDGLAAARVEVDDNAEPLLCRLVENAIPMAAEHPEMPIRLTDTDFLTGFDAVIASCLSGLAVFVPKTRWSDIGGQAMAKLQLQQAIEWPRTKKHLFDRFGFEPVRGVLMHGPPGCSKTLLARACATESKAAFVSLSGADIYSPYLGEAEATVRRAFKAAKSASPAILFFDEIDALVTNRGAQLEANGTENRVLATFLICLDSITSPRTGVVTIGATNRPHTIDPALLRAGRLETKIYVALPDKADRLAVLNIHAAELHTALDIDLARVADHTRGYSGADLGNLCREAGYTAVRRITRLIYNPPPAPTCTQSRRWWPSPPRQAALTRLPNTDADDIQGTQESEVLDLVSLPLMGQIKCVTNNDFEVALTQSRATIDVAKISKLPSHWDDHARCRAGYASRSDCAALKRAIIPSKPSNIL